MISEILESERTLQQLLNPKKRVLIRKLTIPDPGYLVDWEIYPHGDWADYLIALYRLKKQIKNPPKKVLKTIAKADGIFCWGEHELLDNKIPASCSNCPWNAVCLHQDNAGVAPIMEYTLRSWHQLWALETKVVETGIALARAYSHKCLNIDSLVKNWDKKGIQEFNPKIDTWDAQGKRLWIMLQSAIIPVFYRIRWDILTVLSEVSWEIKKPESAIDEKSIQQIMLSFRSSFWELTGKKGSLLNLN